MIDSQAFNVLFNTIKMLKLTDIAHADRFRSRAYKPKSNNTYCLGIQQGDHIYKLSSNTADASFYDVNLFSEAALLVAKYFLTN